jgi:hypothetical protein
VATLRCRLGQQTQVGRDTCPFFISDIAGIGTSVYAPMLRGCWRWFMRRSQARGAVWQMDLLLRNA